MTSQKAIERLIQIGELIRYAKILKTKSAGISEEYYDETQDAIKMAIEALKEVKEWREYKAECDSYHTK